MRTRSTPLAAGLSEFDGINFFALFRRGYGLPAWSPRWTLGPTSGPRVARYAQLLLENATTRRGRLTELDAR